MENAKPLVTVCCITYNHSSFIQDCLNGFLIQKIDFPIEFIIHDDASTDNTQEILVNSVGNDPRFRLVLREVNIKSAGASVLPILYGLAKGNYIAICEGDDLWTLPDKLQKQVEFMEANPEVSLSFHPMDQINSDGEVRAKGKPGPVRLISGLEALNTYIPTLSVIFRRSALDVDRLPRNAPHGDAVLFAYMASKGLIADLGFVGAAYRQHDGGMYSGKSLRKRFLNNVITRRAIQAAGFLTPELQTEMREVIRRKKLKYAKKLFRKLDWIGAWQVMGA